IRALVGQPLAPDCSVAGANLLSQGSISWSDRPSFLHQLEQSPEKRTRVRDNRELRRKVAPQYFRIDVDVDQRARRGEAVAGGAHLAEATADGERHVAPCRDLARKL